MTPQESAREILRIFIRSDRLQAGRPISYDVILQEFPTPAYVEAGLMHALAARWLEWAVKSVPHFKLTQAGRRAAAKFSCQLVVDGR